MTVDQAKMKLLAWVQSQLGTRESGNNWNKYAEDPNMTKLLGWYAQNQPWCNIFCNAAFISVFGLEIGSAMIYQTIGSGSALCRASAQFFKDHGAFTNSPEPGDIVFFYSGGDINHQGIVMRVSGGTVSTIEGNSSDAVSSRNYRSGDSSIAGYGRPKWSLAESASVYASITKPQANVKPQSEQYVTIKVPVLKLGAKGNAVASLQGMLIANKILVGSPGADGDFGPLTASALKTFQSRNGLTADGICGQKTWEALYK